MRNRDNFLPSVAVVVVNYKGKRHLENCFVSLQQLSFPKNKLEIILVDNNSRDGSVEFVRNNFPEVSCVEAATNLGFAQGCNIGAQKAQSDYVSFLNNDAVVHSNWLLELVSAVQQNEKTVCAAAKILDWEGKTIDFVEGSLNFHGFAHQVAWRTRVEPGSFNTRKPILFACGGAMLIDRRLFLDIGGFDEDYFMFYEDVDLGWRLWVLGYDVIFVPEAITYHRHHGSVDKVANARRTFLYERNALATVLKNYEQANLDKILPVALFLAVHRSVSYLQSSNVTPDILHPSKWAELPDRKLKQTIAVGELAPLLAAHDIGTHISGWMAKRDKIQANRQRADQEIFALFGQPLRTEFVSFNLSDSYALTQSKLLQMFEVRQIFAGVGRQVLILTGSGLPMYGFPATPAAERAQALGKGLGARGYEVTFSMPRDLMADKDSVPDSLKQTAWGSDSLDELILRMGVEVVIVCDWRILQFIKWGVYRSIVLDCFLSDMPTSENSSVSLIQCKFLNNVDLFTCPTVEQQKLLQTQLKQAGLEIRPDDVQFVPTRVLPDGSIEGVDALDLFCQQPVIRGNKIRPAPTSLYGLLLKTWYALREGGIGKLKAEVRKYITWRRRSH